MTYKLVCMAFDGDYVTETDRDHRDGWETVGEVWDHCNDMGSRWCLYPFNFVVTGSGQTIVDSPYGLEWMNGKRVKTVKAIFKGLSARPDLIGCDADQFVAEMRATC
jgi:hypothetical protein